MYETSSWFNFWCTRDQSLQTQILRLDTDVCREFLLTLTNWGDDKIYTTDTVTDMRMEKE